MNEVKAEGLTVNIEAGDKTLCPRIRLATCAYTHQVAGSDVYHPAFLTLEGNGKSTVAYWPNIMYKKRLDALTRAQEILDDAHKAAEKVAAMWNVWRV